MYTWFCAAWKEQWAMFFWGDNPRAPFLIWALCGCEGIFIFRQAVTLASSFQAYVEIRQPKSVYSVFPCFFCSCFFQNIFIRLIFKALNFYFGVISALANAYTFLFCQPHLVDSLLYRSDERFYDFLKTFRFLGRTLRQKSCNVVRIGGVFLAKKDIIRRKL